MPQHLRREIENLKKKILALGTRTEEAVRRATFSIQERNRELAIQVIENDYEIDQYEVEIEEDCLKILALHQPVAIDLRFIVAVLKINNDLERIGDLAVNIAERAEFLATREPVGVSLDFVTMADKAQMMLKMSLDALVNLSIETAQQVRSSDDEIDFLNRQMYLKVQQAILDKPDRIESLVHLLSVSRHLERIADHATNIAEDVIYMIQGQIVRHQTENYR